MPNRAVVIVPDVEDLQASVELTRSGRTQTGIISRKQMSQNGISTGAHDESLGYQGLEIAVMVSYVGSSLSVRPIRICPLE